MTRVLFYLDEPGAEVWKPAFEEALPGVDFRYYPDWGTPDDGPAYAFVWHPEPGLIARFPNIAAIFSLGAGIDHLTNDPDLPKHIPIIRMGDDGLKAGMAEFVLMTVMMHHRYMPRMFAAQKTREWKKLFPPFAPEVRVGILGYGALGKASAEVLKQLGYQIAAWSRTPKDESDGVEHFTGEDGLEAFLKRSDILVGLLPSTPETTGLLNKQTMSMLPKRAAIINAGRGTLINIDDLLALLDSGHLSGATLDVFTTEPLPDESPLWDHDKVIVTPHIASITRPKEASEYVARNIARIENGDEPENVLNWDRGY